MCLFFSCRQDLMQCGLASNLLYVKDDLELLTLLPLPLQSWDYRHAPPCPVYAMLGTKPIASCILRKHSTKWAISSVQFFLFCFTPKLYFPTKLGVFPLLLCHKLPRSASNSSSSGLSFPSGTTGVCGSRFTSSNLFLSCSYSSPSVMPSHILVWCLIYSAQVVFPFCPVFLFSFCWNKNTDKYVLATVFIFICIFIFNHSIFFL